MDPLVTVGGDAAKICKNTRLLVIMRVRLLQKIGLHNLTNQTQRNKGNGQKQRMKSIHDYCRIHLMLH